MPLPSLTLSYDPAGPVFPITEQCEMPKITVTVNFKDITPDPKVPLQFRWTVSLVFSGANCAHSLNRKIKHPDIACVTAANKLAIPFTQVRGGDLTVSVMVSVSSGDLTRVLQAKSEKLQVTGTNPSVARLAAAAPNNGAFRKLMRVESGLIQFLSPTCPYFSRDNKGGCGLCQLTYPPPTEDQIWSWKENINGGWALYQEKESTARKYPAKYRHGDEFKALVKAYNAQRMAKLQAAAGSAPSGAATPAAPGTPAKDLTIHLPDFNAEQLERETIRGFNGYAGIQEYRVKLDKDGVLVVTEDPGGTKGTAEWEIVTAAERIKYYDKTNVPANKRGDADYVEDVLKQAAF